MSRKSIAIRRTFVQVITEGTVGVRDVITRRAVLLAGLGATAAATLAACGGDPPPPSSPVGDTEKRLAEIENRFGGRLGVVGIDTGSGARVGRRTGERFLLCSTGKAPTVGAVLHSGMDLERLVRWTPAQIADGNSPFGRAAVGTGATVAQLCEAAITVSDNTAMNLLLIQLGGPSAVTAYVRSLGDPVTRFDRFEPDLNRTTPGDERDTTTPDAIAADLRALVLSDALPPPARDRLTGWLEATTTGGQSIRAGVPAGWRVGDKTGSGAQGETNDIGVVWPPGRAPIVLAVYTSPTDPNTTGGKPAVAAATAAVLEALTRG